MSPFLTACACLALMQTAPAEPSPGGGSFILRTAAGTIGSGPLLKLGPEWAVSLGGAKPVQASGADVVSLRRAGVPLPPWPAEPHLQFANGDRLAGTAIDLKGERLLFRAALGKGVDLAVPLTAISVLWSTMPEGASDREALLRPYRASRRTRDVVLLRNGDVVEGTLASLDAEALVLRGADKKEIRVERNKMAAVILSNDLVRTLRPRGPYGRLVLANGGRISLASAEADSRLLAGKSLFGGALQIPIDQIDALDLYQARAVYLSDLKPRRYEHTPYLGISWPYQLDRSVAGNPLRLHGSFFDKGLGLHSKAELSFDLGGAYQWFEATVGLDEATGQGGSAGIAVLVDGKPQDVGGAQDVTAKDPSRELRIPVKGARELTLIVTFGRHGDVQDHVDWADARLVK